MISFAETQPVAWAVLVLMLVAITGLMLANIRFKGVGLGVTGVLFAGIFAGHLGLHIEKEILDFVREFGLILFVFTIGLQLGPGFFASLRSRGLKLNGVAAAIIVLGALMAAAVAAMAGIGGLASLGLFSGATTNTPSLGATQQMLKALPGLDADARTVPSLAYAIAYPGGVLGIISVLLLFKFTMGGKSPEPGKAGGLERMSVVAARPEAENVRVGELAQKSGVVVSRIKRRDAAEIETVAEATRLQQGDVLLAIGTRAALERFRDRVGQESGMNLLQATGRIVSERIVVTQKSVLGRTPAELQTGPLLAVVVTRLMRAEIEMATPGGLRLQFGDVLQVVGEKAAVAAAAKALGNQVHQLQETNFLPIFIGIALGVLAGLVPITLPHLPVPVSLGLAGGPLILAILLARIGHVGSLVWYMPPAANRAFRELGIVLFLACVGLKAGDKFFPILFSEQGLKWLLAGLGITLIPLLLGGLAARFILKLEAPVIGGLLAGSMTDPPALAFAHAINRSDAPLVAYATVYPLAMLLRIFAAQILVLALCG